MPLEKSRRPLTDEEAPFWRMLKSKWAGVEKFSSIRDAHFCSLSVLSVLTIDMASMEDFQIEELREEVQVIIIIACVVSLIVSQPSSSY